MNKEMIEKLTPLMNPKSPCSLQGQYNLAKVIAKINNRVATEQEKDNQSAS